MKRLLATVAMMALAAPAFAQAPVTGFPTVVQGQGQPPYFTSAPVGQNPPPQGIAGQTYLQNTDLTGFGEHTISPLVTATGTTQATATLLLANVNVITACGAGGTSGVLLPALFRYSSISIVNRCGFAVKVYPSYGSAIETAPGTVGAVNAPATMASATDMILRLAVIVTSAAGVTPVTFGATWYQ